jgi:hypothetical protein
MKTKFYALLASAALIAQAKAGGHHGGGGGGGFAAPHAGAGARAGAPGFYSAPRGNFGGGRFMAPGPRYSSYHGPTAVRQQRVGSFDRGFARSGQFSTGTANRRIDTPRTLNHRQSGLTRNVSSSENRFANRGANAARDHVFARRSADWHRDWDRHRDHWWHGHRCRFVNGFWFIYDIGFYPYDYWYPYDYYANGYYPYQYEYDPGVYEGGGTDYYGQGAYDSSDQSVDSTVVAAQEQLARQGYYRGEIDGIFGPETGRAVMRYQSGHGLRVTGRLNTDTLCALGLPRVASN